MILNAISPHSSLQHKTLAQLWIFALAAAPGYFVAAWTMDRIGRKLIQSLGFFIMGLSFAAIALISAIDSKVKLFLAIYAISYFFTEFGPMPRPSFTRRSFFPFGLAQPGTALRRQLESLGLSLAFLSSHLSCTGEVCEQRNRRPLSSAF